MLQYRVGINKTFVAAGEGVNIAIRRSMSKTFIFDESKYTDKEIHDPKGELLLSNIKSEIKNNTNKKVCRTTH